MRYAIFPVSLISFASAAAFAATPIDLSKVPSSFIQKSSTATDEMSFKEKSRHVDFNNTTHIRFQQQYKGYPVWGAHGIVHIPADQTASHNRLGSKQSTNGTAYKNLKNDLDNVPSVVFTQSQAEKVFQYAKQRYLEKNGITKFDDQHKQLELVVYVDQQNKAHWAYLVSFVANQKNSNLAIPTYIIDAITLQIYEEWNNLQTLESVSGGGFGGNPKLGKLVYDGLQNHLPVLNITRNSITNMCTLKNDEVTVADDTNATGPFSKTNVAKFECKAKDPEHNNLYWNGDQDATNGGYSPVNDSLYIGEVVKNMYMNWYQQPVLTVFGYPIQLVMHAHAKDLWGQPMDNAFFFPLTMQMYFGDGVKYFYPLTSIGVGAHELSHGFTSNHSNLTYQKQSGGLNESYSDMAAQAAEFYSSGKNSWQIGPEIVKDGGALRYMDDPTKDGKSIGHVKDYNDDLNVHYSSGIFNKVFYTLGTTEGWSTRKAFDVMVKANMDYWTANSTFQDAACGVMKATRDYQYDTIAVAHAFSIVGIDASRC